MTINLQAASEKYCVEYECIEAGIFASAEPNRAAGRTKLTESNLFNIIAILFV